jgi:tetratricopeptide (TPR) repeat protein
MPIMDSGSEKLRVAFQHHQDGNLPEAVRLYGEILAEHPNCAPAWHFLGLIAHQAGKCDQAIGNIRRAVELIPDYVDAHRNLGVVLHDFGQYREAVLSFRRVLDFQPNNAEVNDLLGFSYYLLGEWSAAMSCYQRALSLEPNNVAACNHLGILHSDLGNPNEAVACYRRAVALRPNFVEAWTNLGLALTELEQDSEAIACHNQAIAFQPQRAELYSNLGGAFEKRGDLDDALANYRRAIKLQPNLAEAQVNLGNVLSKQGKLQEAVPCYHRALELRPDYADAHTGLAALMHLQGDYAGAWVEYEWRLHCKRMVQRHFQQQIWDGAPLNGKTIFIHYEQGLGDTFQFIRYLPLIKAQGATVIMEAQKPLIRLLANAPGIDRLVAAGDELPQFDVYAPLLSLPRIFRTTLDNIPAKFPYLFADRQLVELWRKKLQGVSGFRVGLNWRGRSSRGIHLLRDIPIECIASLAQLSGVQLISLQQGNPQRELAAHCNGASVVDLGDEIDQLHGAFMDTAAIMMNLDLVISSDTSVPHLAGALGTPVWVSLPHVPDWRWLLDRDDSPWYPTMRLFRQKNLGDWAGVFEEIKVALYERLQRATAGKAAISS